jgi:methionine aminopeptidase
MIHLKTPAEVAKMREAGLVVAAALDAVRAAVAPGVTTHDLDVVAADTIRDAGATSNFKGYAAGGDVPFPATICASINDEVVHGIPSKKRVLRDGDIVSIDCGAVLDGWHGDSAFTAAVGEVDPAIATMADHWTVSTIDRSWAAHFEHSFAVTPDGPLVLTAVDFGVAPLGALGVAVPVPSTPSGSR